MENLWESLTQPPINLPLLWFLFFTIMAIAEMLTPFFGLILVGASGLVAAVFAAFGFGFVIQIVVFAVACFLSLVLLRPKIVAKLHSKAHVPERTEILRGQTGEVTQPITPTQQGRITVNGEDWAAQSETSFSRGDFVKVVGADGIVLKVDKVN